MEELQRQINELKAELQLIKSSTTIPFPVEQAFRDRLKINSLAELQSQSTKTAASETQAIDEGGMGSFNVAKPMDGFFVWVKDNSTYYVPYYNA